jgi:hypothetical protein
VARGEVRRTSALLRSKDPCGDLTRHSIVNDRQNLQIQEVGPLGGVLGERDV